MNIVSLFTGVGGFDLAAQQIGADFLVLFHPISAKKAE